nr:hypothetical protein CFP56_02721 [Quercus suber]
METTTPAYRMGDGLTKLVIKSTDAAQRRGGQIYSRIVVEIAVPEGMADNFKWSTAGVLHKESYNNVTDINLPSAHRKHMRLPSGRVQWCFI